MNTSTQRELELNEPMEDAKTIALTRALKLLVAAGVKYKVVGHDGTEYGELKIAVEPVKAKRGAKYGWGKLTQYVRPYIAGLLPGQMAVIPYSDAIDAEDIRHAAAREMGLAFGNASYICVRSTNGVEALRV